MQQAFGHAYQALRCFNSDFFEQLDAASGRQVTALQVRGTQLQGGDDLAVALKFQAGQLVRLAAVGTAQAAGTELPGERPVERGARHPEDTRGAFHERPPARMTGRQVVETPAQVDKRLHGNAAVLAHASWSASSSLWPGAFTEPSPLTYVYRVVVVMPSRFARVVHRQAQRGHVHLARLAAQAPSGGGGADLGTGEHAQADTVAVQLLDRRHQMFQVAPQAIELPGGKRVARLQGLQAGSVVMASRGAVFVDALFVDAGIAWRHAAGQGVEYRQPWRLSRSRSAWCLPSLSE